VTESCSSRIIPAAAVQTAVSTVPVDRISAILGFEINGDFIQSPSITRTPSSPQSDRKLWIIGAVLGPIAFVLLLIGLCCFIHYKCRPRSNNGGFAQVYS
jgi:hypothetical protein